MRRWISALELLVIFCWDFLFAVLQVGSWIFRPNRELKPAIVRFPTKLKNPKALWILSLIIFLTPGSLIVETVDEKGILYIHFFHTDDPDGALLHIRQRFETRLQDIFEKGGPS